MNVYRHELRYRVRSRTSVAVAIVVGLTLALGYAGIYGAESQVAISASGFEYYSAGAFHVDLWVVDVIGDPVAGVQVNLVVTPTTNETTFPPPPPPPALFNETLVSNATGQVAFDVLLAPGQYDATFHSTYPARPLTQLTGELFGATVLDSAPGGVPTPLLSPLVTVATGYYVESARLLAVWGGPNGSSPVGDSVVACGAVLDFFQPGPQNCSGLATTPPVALTGYRTLLPLPTVALPPVGQDQQAYLLLEIVNATGAVLFVTQEFFPATPEPSIVSSNSGPGPGLLGAFAADLALLVALAAFLIVYWSYARPRLSGTVEMVLVRPVTREGLFLTRYLAMAIVLAAAGAATVLLFDLGVTELLAQPLPPAFVAALFGSFLAAGMGFAGITFLAAHAFRSSRGVLALGIGLLLVCSLFWNILVALVAYFAGLSAANATAAAELVARSQLLAPPQFPAIVSGLLTEGEVYGIGSASYAGAGVTAAWVVAAALAWIVGTFVLTYWRVHTRD